MGASNVTTDIPGWHGKLPSLGDFASRRLDAGVIEAWDMWLAAGVLGLRERAPEAWLEAYLSSPSWRFLLTPGVMPGEGGASAWAGVLMPSVDRVGRYFPFTILKPLAQLPSTPLQMASLWHWLGRLDELAGDALHDDWQVDRLEAELARMAAPDLAPVPSTSSPMPQGEGHVVEIDLPDAVDAPTHLGLQAQALWGASAEGLAYWFSRTETSAPRLVVSRGLPTAGAIGSLLGRPAA